MHYDAPVRTTIDLPEDLHDIARSIAADSRQTLSATIAQLLRQALSNDGPAQIDVDPITGWPIVHIGRTITTEDVKSLEDDI